MSRQLIAAVIPSRNPKSGEIEPCPLTTLSCGWSRRSRLTKAKFGVLSTGEFLAVALVLDREDLLKASRGDYTMLEAADRLGNDWFDAALRVQRSIDLPAD